MINKKIFTNFFQKINVVQGRQNMFQCLMMLINTTEMSFILSWTGHPGFIYNVRS